MAYNALASLDNLHSSCCSQGLSCDAKLPCILSYLLTHAQTFQRQLLHCRYVRPQFVDETAPARLKIRQGRHPVLDVALDTPVVPNDTDLKAEGPCALVITGPNMGGKSCYIRQAALIAIMAQVWDLGLTVHSAALYSSLVCLLSEFSQSITMC